MRSRWGRFLSLFMVYLPIQAKTSKNHGMPIESCRTAAQATEWFLSNGITISNWALENGFDPKIVYALLSGRTRGRRGRSHAAAVALGMKPDPALFAKKEHASKGQ